MCLMVEDGLVIGHHCESDGGGWACYRSLLLA